jgi:hypothetical protein
LGISTITSTSTDATPSAVGSIITGGGTVAREGDAVKPELPLGGVVRRACRPPRARTLQVVTVIP